MTAAKLDEVLYLSAYVMRLVEKPASESSSQSRSQKSRMQFTSASPLSSEIATYKPDLVLISRLESWTTRLALQLHLELIFLKYRQEQELLYIYISTDCQQPIIGTEYTTALQYRQISDKHHQCLAAAVGVLPPPILFINPTSTPVLPHVLLPPPPVLIWP